MIVKFIAMKIDSDSHHLNNLIYFNTDSSNLTRYIYCSNIVEQSILHVPFQIQTPNDANIVEPNNINWYMYVCITTIAIQNVNFSAPPPNDYCPAFISPIVRPLPHRANQNRGCNCGIARHFCSAIPRTLFDMAIEIYVTFASISTNTSMTWHQLQNQTNTAPKCLWIYCLPGYPFPYSDSHSLRHLYIGNLIGIEWVNISGIVNHFAKTEKYP